MFWEIKSNDNLALLKTVYNAIELEIVKGILQDHGITCIVKDRGAGGYMKIFAGNTGFFRTDILVDQEAYETAKELIEQYQQE
jgi:hypothetical protein